MVSRKKPSRSRSEPPAHVREATRRARAEAREIAERKRLAARESRSGARTRRRLTGSALARAAPQISRALLLAVRIPAALIATLLDVFLQASGWLRARLGPLTAGLADLVARTVTPVRTLALVGAAAAVALAASQFADYRGIAVASELYEGEIGSVAPAPLTDLEPGGSAHGYVMIPLALAAIALIVATARGRWRLGRVVGLIGLAAIAVSALVDAPQGLDAGRSGVAYSGTDARLIEGFWAQLAAAAALLFCGPLLGRYARLEGELSGSLGKRRRLRSPRRRRPAPRARRLEARA